MTAQRLRDFREKRLGYSIQELATALGFATASGVQGYHDVDCRYEDRPLPHHFIKRMLALVGKGTPVITEAEVLALADEDVRHLTADQREGMDIIRSLDSGGMADVLPFLRTRARMMMAHRPEQLPIEYEWETDRDHRFVKNVALGPNADLELATRRSAVIMGKTRWELAGIDPNNPPDDDWVRHLADLDARRPFTFTYVHDRPNGMRKYRAETQGEPLFDDLGRFTGYKGLATVTVLPVEELPLRPKKHGRKTARHSP